MSDFSNSSSCMIDPPPLMAGSDQSCWDMWRKASSSALHSYLRTACATYCSAPHTRSLYRSPGTAIGKSIDYLDFATIELPAPAYVRDRDAAVDDPGRI